MQNCNKLISYKKNYFVCKQRKIQLSKCSGLSQIIMLVFRTRLFFFLHKFALPYYSLSLLFFLLLSKQALNEPFLSTGNYSYNSLLNNRSVVVFITYVNVSGLFVSVIMFFFLQYFNTSFCSLCFACLCKVLLLCMSPLISFGSVVDHLAMYILIVFIIHQTHYEKSDWSRAFNQFTIACELDMINVISAADITFIMSSSTSAWLLSPLECSPQKQNG